MGITRKKSTNHPPVTEFELKSIFSLLPPSSPSPRPPVPPLPLPQLAGQSLSWRGPSPSAEAERLRALVMDSKVSLNHDRLFANATFRELCSKHIFVQRGSSQNPKLSNFDVKENDDNTLLMTMYSLRSNVPRIIDDDDSATVPYPPVLNHTNGAEYIALSDMRTSFKWKSKDYSADGGEEHSLKYGNYMK